MHFMPAVCGYKAKKAPRCRRASTYNHEQKETMYYFVFFSSMT